MRYACPETLLDSRPVGDEETGPPACHAPSRPSPPVGSAQRQPRRLFASPHPEGWVGYAISMMEDAALTHGQLPAVWVVVPTYWGPREASPFDHPTPLDGDSTLPRLLESLSHQHESPPFAVLLLAAAVSDHLLQPAAARVRSLAAPFRRAYPIYVADPALTEEVVTLLRGEGLDPTGIDLASYAGVRNLQLLLPAACGAELVIALDDDEVVPPSHIARAVQVARSLDDQALATGVAGPYLDASGSVFLPEKEGDLFASKTTLMNRTLRTLLASKDPFPVTPLALGGNMVFPRTLLARVGFDPGITRGEDIDYLINARLEGLFLRFDRKLAVTHLPPRQYEAPEYAKLRHDVYRFFYQREKIRTAGLDPATLDPYPGRFLRDDLAEHAGQALRQAFQPEYAEVWGPPEAILDSAQQFARERAPAYAGFARRWPRIISVLSRKEPARRVHSGLIQA